MRCRFMCYINTDRKRDNIMFTGTFSTHINYRRMKSSLDYVFYASVFLFVEGVTGRIMNAPSNAVAEVGGQAIFNCTSDTTVQSWIFSTNREEYEASTGQTIATGCIVQTGFTSNYAVDRPGGSNFICNLIVKATTVQESGVYTCTDTSPGPSAILTVIDRNASITVSRNPETLEGDTVRMYYSVRYSTSTVSPRTPTIQPVLNWTDSDGNTVAGSPTETTNSVLSFISVDAKRKDITPYTCNISYVIKPSSLATGQPFASNTPNSLPNPPSTETINVLYFPIISEITMSDKAPVCPGKTVVEITCHATANPAPIYSWIGPDSRNYSGATIEAATNGTYSCTASNVIRGSTHSDTKDAPITVLYSSDDGCQPMRIIVIIIVAVAVVVAYLLFNFMATVIFLSYYNQNTDFKLKMNDRFSWLREMLPCMDESVACRCYRIFISVLVFTLFGILFVSSILIVAECSQRRRRSQASAQQFQNWSDITDGIENHEMGNRPNHNGTLGTNGDDTYEQTNVEIVYMDSSRIGKDHKMHQNGKEKGYSVSTDKTKNPPPPFDGDRNPSGNNPKPMSETLASPSRNPQQPTVYSDLPLANLNIQPEQYLESNKDNNTYSELNKA